MRRFLATLLLLCVLTGAAADDFGQSYHHFQTLYASNVDFINTNTGRHLLPLSFTSAFDGQGKCVYVLDSGALSVRIQLDDLDSQIASCLITLTAPAGMSYGDSAYGDFTTSGYQSYALLMAMSKNDAALERYALVEEVNNGLAANGGLYETQVGDYRLTCQSQDGVATMLFENELLLSTGLETEDEAPSVEIIN